ncbi:hypothetical protein QBC39DRAFT_174848 [Podospora conica]|nr:hypothetical protein QBC39DRAFT_174848 [Schizothecium conicum]
MLNCSSRPFASATSQLNTTVSHAAPQQSANCTTTSTTTTFGQLPGPVPPSTQLNFRRPTPASQILGTGSSPDRRWVPPPQQFLAAAVPSTPACDPLPVGPDSSSRPPPTPRVLQLALPSLPVSWRPQATKTRSHRRRPLRRPRQPPGSSTSPVRSWTQDPPAAFLPRQKRDGHGRRHGFPGPSPALEFRHRRRRHPRGHPIGVLRLCPTSRPRPGRTAHHGHPEPHTGLPKAGRLGTVARDDPLPWPRRV